MFLFDLPSSSLDNFVFARLKNDETLTRRPTKKDFLYSRFSFVDGRLSLFGCRLKAGLPIVHLSVLVNYFSEINSNCDRHYIKTLAFIFFHLDGMQFPLKRSQTYAYGIRNLAFDTNNDGEN